MSQYQPDPEDATKFWSGIWGEEIRYNDKAEWIGNLEGKIQREKQDNINITEENIKEKVRTIPNWKAPGPDGLQGYWLKNLSFLHKNIAENLSECISTGNVPDWLVEGRTTLLMKDPTKGTEVGNYRPIACLNLLWKLLTGVISDKTYMHLENNNLFPNEQKGGKRKCQGTKDQLAIDRAMLKNCKRRSTNLSMAWIDFKKAYDMVPHSWIIATLKLFGVADNIIELLEKSMKQWKTNLYAGGSFLGTVDIKRGIFQGDSFSPLLFVIILIPLTMVLRESRMGYELEKKGTKINHMLFMDDLKIYGKNENEVDSLVKTVHQCSSDIGMEFGVSKCAVLTMKRGKRVESRGIRLPNGEEMDEPNNEGYKYLGVLELDGVLCSEMKEKVKKEYMKRLKLMLKTKLNSRNLFLGINTWAVAVVRYSAAFIDWTKEETREMDRQTRKMLFNYGAIHPKANTLRIYMHRKRGGRGLIGIEECVASELRNLHHYLANNHEEVLKAVAKEENLRKEDIAEKEEYKRKVEDEKREMVMKMKLHGQFERDTKELKTEESWNWIRKGDLKRETESLIMAAQEQALNTNAVKKNIYGLGESDKCRRCGKEIETVTHIISACSMLAQKEYKRRHDKVCLNLHWNLCKKYGIVVNDKWYQHQVEGVMENDKAKILWDFMIQCDREICHRKPDIVVIDKDKNECIIIDVACPGDHNILKKRNEKIDKYSELRLEISRLWNKKTSIVPIVIGALGSIPKGLQTYLKQLEIHHNIDTLQKSVLLGTANIIRKVLSSS